jgi:hypothetical protein
MKETVLKKEFSKKDVQRMRNIISNKSGDRTQLLVGWEKYIPDRSEGDVWEEDGRSWTILNGIKQTVLHTRCTLSTLSNTCGRLCKLSAV